MKGNCTRNANNFYQSKRNSISPLEREKELEEAHLTVEQVSEELLTTKRRLLASLDDNHVCSTY